MLLLLGTLAAVAAAAAASGGDERLQLSVAKHFTCPKPKTGALAQAVKQNRFIEFSSSKTAPLVTLEPGCFKLQGKMRLADDLYTENLQLKMTIRLDSYKSKPEKCVDFDGSGCGGTGSCLHCNLCQFKKDIQNWSGSDKDVGIKVDGRRLVCGDKLQGRRYHNIQIKFCLPTRNQFIKNQGLTAKEWSDLWSSISGRSDKSLAAFVDIYLYDRPMQSFAKELYEKRDSSDCQASRSSPRHKACKKAVRSLQATFSGKAAACHRLYGSLHLDPVEKKAAVGRGRGAAKKKPASRGVRVRAGPKAKAKPKARLSAAQKRLLEQRRRRLLAKSG